MLADLFRPRPENRSSNDPNLSLMSYLQQFAYNGHTYTAGSLDHRAAEIVASNAAVGAVLNFRVSVFSEATFKFQGYQSSRPGQMFGTPVLSLLERPWPGAGTSHLLATVEVDVSVYGNSYWIEAGGQMVRLDPCAVTIVTENVMDPEGVNVVGTRLIGYAFKPEKAKESSFFPPNEVGHVRLLPDPGHQYRGTSWLRAVMADVDADTKMTGYKQALLDNSAVPGLVLRAEPGVSPEQLESAREVLKARNTGWDKVGRTLILGAGFDAKVVGSSMQQLDMKALQGAGESRIAAAAGVSPVLAGFSEGLQGSSLNAGNYGAARRRFADGTVRPLWRAACTAFSTLVPAPTGARLWYDERDVSFLQEDVMDAAEIMSKEALTIEALIRSGWEPKTARDAVTARDFTLLNHSGLVSVQLQPPGSGPTPLAP